MTTPLTTLKKLAREAELEVIEYPDGRVLVVGGLVNVHGGRKAGVKQHIAKAHQQDGITQRQRTS